MGIFCHRILNNSRIEIFTPKALALNDKPTGTKLYSAIMIIATTP